MKTTTRPRYILVAFLAVLISPQNAHAHLTSSGMGPFYDGVKHLVVSPEDLLGVIALALLAGQYGKLFGRSLLFTLPAAWIAGGLGGLLKTTETPAPIVSALSLLSVGVLLALSVQLNVVRFSGIAALFGLIHGYLNGTSAASSGAGLSGIAGVVMTVFVVVAFLTSFSVSLRAAWMKIAIRVAGSWIAAIGLLMFGWAMKG